jgi:predicted RNA-binding Zn ribbon-like protein
MVTRFIGDIMNEPIPSKWKFVAGQLCLDFVNTVVARSEQKVKNSTLFTFRSDKLSCYVDLAEWSKEAGILKERDVQRVVRVASQNERESKQVFERAITLRESLFRIIKNVIEGWELSNADIELLNRECAIARNRQKLVYSANKFVWDLKAGEDELECMIWPIMLSGAQLLSSEELFIVKQCPSSDCGWLFLDSSKNRSRQWCDMKDCGNLAKVRRYRERQKKR